MPTTPALTQKPQQQPQCDWCHSAGTIFHDILIWSADLTGWQPPSQPPAHAEAHSARSAPPAHSATPAHSTLADQTLRGHCGSILQLRWACGNRLLLSAADDRTARVWRVPAPPQGARGPALPAAAAADAVAPTLTLWGHAARVWDAECLGSCALPSRLRLRALYVHTIHACEPTLGIL